MVKFFLSVFLLASTWRLHFCVENTGYSWITFAKGIKHNFNGCLRASQNTTWECLREASLQSFDEVMSKDVIPLTNEIRFVRLPSASTHSTPKTLFNNRFDLWLMRGVSSWQKRVLAKFCRVLSTHVLRFDMKGSSTELEGRGRHRRRNQMLPAMMFGVTALGMVIIPLGFQFLAVLSGKALVLSKLALILASINGLKRIATSGLNFGLYQVPADQYHYYDRDDVNRLH